MCHRFLPIDRYNRYQSNQIYRFLSTYRVINRYRFLSIDYSGNKSTITTMTSYYGKLRFLQIVRGVSDNQASYNWLCFIFITEFISQELVLKGNHLFSIRFKVNEASIWCQYIACRRSDQGDSEKRCEQKKTTTRGWSRSESEEGL